LGRAGADGRIGYIYVQDGDDGPLRCAQPGCVVSNEGEGPPWIVTNEVIASIIVAKWPGQLWKARIIKAASKRDQPYAYAKYVRCISVEILERIDPSALFGDHGQGVVQVLSKAAELKREQAAILSAARHAEASSAYDRVFRRWIAGRFAYYDNAESYDGTLAAGPPEAGRSPIGCGLTLILRTLSDRAELEDGPRAFDYEDDGTPYLIEPWSGACKALLDAALALGAPHLSTDEDQDRLLFGWSKL
jgi:hypothetical protein